MQKRAENERSVLLGSQRTGRALEPLGLMRPGSRRSAAPPPQTARGSPPEACGRSPQTPPAAAGMVTWGEAYLTRRAGPAGLSTLGMRAQDCVRCPPQQGPGTPGCAGKAAIAPGKHACTLHKRRHQQPAGHAVHPAAVPPDAVPPGHTSALGSSAARRRELAAGTSASLAPWMTSTLILWRRTARARRSACVRWPSPCRGQGQGRAGRRASCTWCTLPCRGWAGRAGEQAGVDACRDPVGQAADAWLLRKQPGCRHSRRHAHGRGAAACMLPRCKQKGPQGWGAGAESCLDGLAHAVPEAVLLGKAGGEEAQHAAFPAPHQLAAPAGRRG